MKKIYPGIYVINIKSRFKLLKPPANIYAILGKDDGLIFDSGYGNKKFVKEVVDQIIEIEKIEQSKKNIVKFDRIFISHAHPDHFSGLCSIRKKLGLKIMLTQKMANRISSTSSYRKSFLIKYNEPGGIITKFKKNLFYLSSFIIGYIYKMFYGIHFVKDPDLIIDENSIIEINNEKWTVFPSPGHSDCHISLYNIEKGVLLAGDNILRKKTSWLGPPKSDLLKYINSMEELLELPGLKLVLAAHGSPIYNPQKRIRQIIHWRLKRIEDVYSVIENSAHAGINFRSIFKKLYPEQNIIKFHLYKGWIQLTLKYLLDNKRIIKLSDKNKFRYMSSSQYYTR